MATEGLSLVGFLPEQAATAHLRKGCIVPDASDDALASEWRAARDRIGPPVANAGRPDMRPMPREAARYLDELVKLDWVEHHLRNGLSGSSFAMVEVDPLLSVQFNVDSERARQHASGAAGQAPTLDELLACCLPSVPTVEPVRMEQSTGSMLLTSRSMNLLTVAHGHLSNNIVGIRFGINFPFLQVSRVNGRCYLRDGVHRAVGLRQRGATHVPCILTDVVDHAAVGISATGGTFDAPLLESANPPTIGHFTQGRAHPVMLKAFFRTLHVSWSEYVTTY